MKTSDTERIIQLFDQGWMSNILAVVGLVLAFVFYVKGKARTGLIYRLSEITLVSEDLAAGVPGLEVLVDRRAVPRLTSTTIDVWNSGTTTIDGSQIVASDSLRVDLLGAGQALRYEITGTTRQSLGVAISKRPIPPDLASAPDSLELKFDFLDPNDGLQIQILHYGTEGTARVRGTIKGLTSGVRRYDPDAPRLPRGLYMILSSALGLACNLRYHASAQVGQPEPFFWYAGIALISSAIIVGAFPDAVVRLFGGAKVKPPRMTSLSRSS